MKTENFVRVTIEGISTDLNSWGEAMNLITAPENKGKIKEVMPIGRDAYLPTNYPSLT